MSDEKLERIESKIDKLSDKISSIDATLAAQHVSIVEHIKRSDLLEEKMTVLEKHDNMIDGVLKFVGVIAIILTAAGALLPLIFKGSK